MSCEHLNAEELGVQPMTELHCARTTIYHYNSFTNFSWYYDFILYTEHVVIWDEKRRSQLTNWFDNVTKYVLLVIKLI